MLRSSPTRLALLLPIVAAALAAPVPAAADDCFELEVFPSPAPFDEPLVARFVGEWRDSCVPRPAGWRLDGEEVVFTLDGRPPGGCLSAITPFDFETSFGPLLPGSYTARVEVIGEPECTAEPEPFVVAATGSAPALERPGTPPAATLLLPYFEVDLGSPSGLTTLFAVANQSPAPTLAHVVLWTDLGIPTLAFDLPLGGHDVQTVNLRDVFLQGRLPPVPAEPAFPGCVPRERLPDPELRAELVARHTGRPAPGDGLCWGSGLAPDRATGYVTIDVARRCSASVVFPTQPGYFAGDDPVAGFDNVLWGDYFYVDPAEASAQGDVLVGLAAARARTVGTFYERYPDAGADGREPLASGYRGRFLRGGPFSGGTDFVVWLQEMTGEPAPTACPAAPSSCHALQLFLRDEDGADVSDRTLLPVPALVYRQPAIEVDLPVVPAPPHFGHALLAHRWDTSCATGDLPPTPEPAPAWVSLVLRADGRYSVGLAATPVE